MVLSLPSQLGKFGEELESRINNSHTYSTKMEDWGDSFNGNILFEVLEDDTYSEGVKYLYFELEDGTCLETRTVNGEDDVNWGFKYSGEYSEWKNLLQDNQGVNDVLTNGGFILDGDLKIFRDYKWGHFLLAKFGQEMDLAFEY